MLAVGAVGGRGVSGGGRLGGHGRGAVGGPVAAAHLGGHGRLGGGKAQHGSPGGGHSRAGQKSRRERAPAPVMFSAMARPLSSWGSGGVGIACAAAASRRLRRRAASRLGAGGNFRLGERVGHGLLHPGRRNGGPGDGVDIGTLGRLDHLGVSPVADGLVAAAALALPLLGRFQAGDAPVIQKQRHRDGALHAAPVPDIHPVGVVALGPRPRIGRNLGCPGIVGAQGQLLGRGGVLRPGSFEGRPATGKPQGEGGRAAGDGRRCSLHIPSYHSAVRSNYFFVKVFFFFSSMNFILGT